MNINECEIMICKCGKSDLLQNMWHNPNTDDIKCNNCFLDCLTICIKKMAEPKGLINIIRKRIFGIRYPKILTDYYKGSFLLAKRTEKEKD